MTRILMKKKIVNSFNNFKGLSVRFMGDSTKLENNLEKFGEEVVNMIKNNDLLKMEPTH